MSGTAYDLRSGLQIGEILDMLADTNRNAINVTYCLPGPTGSRLAARFALVFLLKRVIVLLLQHNDLIIHVVLFSRVNTK